jgi:hypothetical protein
MPNGNARDGNAKKNFWGFFPRAREQKEELGRSRGKYHEGEIGCIYMSTCEVASLVG